MHNDLSLYKDILAMVERKFDKIENKIGKKLDLIIARVESNTFFRKVFMLIFAFILPIIVTLIYKTYP